MTSLANTSVNIWSVHFLTYCDSFSFFFQPEPDIWIIVHIAIPSISFVKSVISVSETKTKFRKSLHRKSATLHQTLCILPKPSTSIIDKANNDSISVVLKWHILILEYFRWGYTQSRQSNLSRPFTCLFLCTNPIRQTGYRNAGLL